MELSILGLLIIIIAWGIQAFYMCKGTREIKPLFIAFYMFGVLVLAIDDFNNNLRNLAIFNFISLLTAGLVWIMLSKNKKQNKKEKEEK